MCEVWKASGVINFKFLGVGDWDIFEPQLAQGVECYVSVGTSTLHEELKMKPAPHRPNEINIVAVDLAMECL